VNIYIVGYHLKCTDISLSFENNILKMCDRKQLIQRTDIIPRDRITSAIQKHLHNTSY